ncbi:MAG: type II and III secretion system protein, partial [Verrucomicrobiota bacterium]
GIKMITVEDQHLKEMGLDFLLGAANVGGGTPRVFFAGGTDGNSSNPVGTSTFPFTNPNTGIPVGMNPVTSGLRSGDLSTSQSINDVISRDNPGVGGTRAPGVFSIAGVFTDPQFQLLLRALNQTKGVDLLNDIHVVAKPGQIAKIEQVREFIYPTEYDPPELPNEIGGFVDIGGTRFLGEFSGIFPATPATPTAFETRNLGAVIEVEPTVGADNLTIGLNIVADFSEFSGFINYGIPILNANFLVDGEPSVITQNRILMPVFDAVKETTNVTVWDRQTVAIGGFHGETVTASEDKIPYLGDLPALGRAFRTNTYDSTRRALLIFVTAELIDPGGNLINAPEEEADLITRQDVPPLRPITSGGPPPAGAYPAK